MKKEKFAAILEAVVCCYDASAFDKLPKVTDFPEDLFDLNEELNTKFIYSFVSTIKNKYFISVINRILLFVNISKAQDGISELDVELNWKLVADSILLVSDDEIVASVGSQGFLSIPIYKFNDDIEHFQFLRLHIWDASLDKFIDRNKGKNFSIHSHKFHAHSWVICGNVINDRFVVKETSQWSSESMFSVEYNNSINKVNQHTSCAENADRYVHVKQISHEVYMPQGTYQIKAGDFHKSDALQDGVVSATFFMFTARYSMVNTSYVVGPSGIQNSEINRKLHANTHDLVKKIDSQIHPV